MWQREEVLEQLRKRQGNRSLRSFAREIGCSAAYLSDVYRGKRSLGPKVLEELGLEKIEQSPPEPLYRKRRWR